jgi:hypothetical protein
MRETWYVLEDGSVAEPRDIGAGKKAGLLAHKKSGVAVAMRGDVPSTRSVDPEEERAKRAAPPQKDRQLKAENEGKYKTRGVVNSRD